MIGQKIGSYTVVEKLGEGGMGVVFRATDSRLHRDVALKLLPEALSKDPQIMGRFEREAQVLASLNHPNIAAIYGVEENDGQRVLVMELVAGDELATVIARGQLPLEEALRIALGIAEALEAAHDQGIVHRDLKPANIKLGRSTDSAAGTRVKILDFGLAKALQGDLASSSPDLTRSPTLSVAATQAGMILGTAGYMSPEQARALPADRRADIWSFGVILYELLTGRRAFAGDTVADTLAKVIEREPDWSLLPASTPPAVRGLLERCLVKSPRHRLQAIGDARLVLDETLSGVARGSVSTITARAEAAPRARRPVPWLALAPWALAAAALAWAVAASLGGSARRSAGEAPPMRVEIVVGREPFDSGIGSSVALSRDGADLVYTEGDGTRQSLYVRHLDQSMPLLLADGATNADGPYHPFVSPGGDWVGYVTPRELRKVQVTGGTPLKVCDVSRSRGATWLTDDTIVLAASAEGGLARVPAAGGTPTPLTELDAARGERTHRWPQGLPGGDAVLFTSQAAESSFDSASLEVVSLASGERKVVYRGGSYGRYVPSGHLVFVNGGTLFAVPFDLDQLETRGSPVPVLQRLAASASEGGAQFDFSATGLLTYLADTGRASSYPIVAVGRDGVTRTLWSEAGSYGNPRLSPDGRRLALTVLRDENWDVWVYDLERTVATRLTFGDSIDTEQIWSPDGEYLIFSSDQDGPDSLYRKRADGSGEVERLTEAEKPQWASSWSRDGRYVAFIEGDTQYDLWYLDLETRETKEILATQFGEGFPDLSPDGRWMAYASNESGSYEIYVRPFPDGPGKWQVSDSGGSSPRWSPDGRELVWRTVEGIGAAEVETGGSTFRAGKAKQLFDGPFQGGIQGIAVSGFQFNDYDLAPDGQGFVMFPDPTKEGRDDHQHITLVTRWFDELEGLASSGGK